MQGETILSMLPSGFQMIQQMVSLHLVIIDLLYQDSKYLATHVFLGQSMIWPPTKHTLRAFPAQALKWDPDLKIRGEHKMSTPADLLSQRRIELGSKISGPGPDSQGPSKSIAAASIWDSIYPPLPRGLYPQSTPLAGTTLAGG
jgi:hypothetical protein